MERNKIYYCSSEGFCGDFIPFYHDGIYHLYHISGRGWKHVTTKDFVNFEDLGMSIDGSDDENAYDKSIFTGCIMEHEGVFHMFYCGYNDKLSPCQVVLHATSRDLHNWEKDPSLLIKPDGEQYTLFAFRDPYVFYNEEAGEFWMLVTTAITEMRSKRWGTVALYASKDLKNWEKRDPIYSPYSFDSHECPDMFKMGDKWYLVFSEYTRWWETKYRISDSPNGPWEIPANDMFDGRTFYAAKTVSNGKRRFIVGWVCHKTNGDDKTKYMWGGNLLVHEIKQNDDGTLSAVPIKEVLDAFTEPRNIAASDSFGGEWKIEGDRFLGKAEGFSTIKLGSAGSDTLYKAKIKIAPNTFSAGIVFRAEYPFFDKWCMLKIEQKKGRIYFDSFYKFFDDVFFDEIRPIKVTVDNVYDLKIITSGNIFSVYLNDDVALSGRCYSYLSGDFGLFVENGTAEFFDLSVLESTI